MPKPNSREEQTRSYREMKKIQNVAELSYAQNAFSKKRRDAVKDSKYIAKLLWREYELVQRKIDNASDFPFKVKAASITLLAAFLTAAIALKINRNFILGGILIPISFAALQSYHEHVKKSLLDRAVNLEIALRKLNRNLPNFNSIAIPGIVQSLHDTTKPRNDARFVWKWKRFSFSGGLEALLHNLSYFWWKVTNFCEGLFWLLQIALLLIAACNDPSKIQSGNSIIPPPVNVTVPPVNVTVPPVNVTVPPVNVTVPPVNVTVPPVNVTVPPVNVTVPPVNVTVPPVNKTVVMPTPTPTVHADSMTTRHDSDKSSVHP